MTAPLQTRFEQIASAFPLHAQRIAECAGPKWLEWSRNTPVHDGMEAGHVLRGAFHWAQTQEGHNYWRRLAALPCP